MTQAVRNPLAVWNDLSGQPLQNGQLFFGQPYLNPETSPIVVYWDREETQPVSQPVRTIGGMPSRNGTPAELFFTGDFSITVRDSSGRMLYYSPSAVNAGVTAPLLPAANVVVASGDAAQDSLNLRGAIRIAPVWGIIQIVGALRLNGTFIVKPRIAIINGSGASITHLTPNVNLFELKDDIYAGAGNGSIQPVGTVWTGTGPLDGATNRTLDAFPGFFRLEGFQIDGAVTADARLPANNEPLGVFTKSLHSAAVWMENNGQLNHVSGCWFRDWDHAIYSYTSGRLEAVDNRMFNCKFGVHIGAECHQSKVDNWIEYGFIGLAVCYGVGQAGGVSFIHTLTYDGVYQSCFVGTWFEGLYESAAGGAIYYELNIFRDLQIGWAGNQCVGLAVPTMIHSSPCSGSWPGNPATPFTFVQVPAISAPHNNGCPVDIWQGVSIDIQTGIFTGSAPTGPRKLVQVDGASDSIKLGYDRWSSTDPWRFDDESRVMLSQPGRFKRGTNARLPFWSWQQYWGKATEAGFPSFNDPGQPGFYQAHAWQDLVSYSNGIQGEAFIFGTKDAPFPTETRMLFAPAYFAFGDPAETTVFMSFKGGATAYGVEQGKFEYFTNASLNYSCNRFSVGLKFAGQQEAPPTIASATNMDLVVLGARPLSFVSGTAAIQNIGVGAGFLPNNSRLTFIPTGAWTTVTGGNIARAITAVVNQPVDFIYNSSTNTWYPK